MALVDLTDWMEEFGRPGFVWYAKRLSGNDTLANGSNQAGPYLQKEFLFELFPTINRQDTENPDCYFDLYIDSHSDARKVRAVWYNNKLRGGTRNETRLTNFGGNSSALLDPESTGSISVFVFMLKHDGSAKECHVWVCNRIEEDLLEERIGPVEPKQFVIWRPGLSELHIDIRSGTSKGNSTCSLDLENFPPEWLTAFPTGIQLIRKTIELKPLHGLCPDVRLLRRRKCEFELFKSVEKHMWMPKISHGFSSIENFLGLANTILQSRKSRSGKSLEYHTSEIFSEDGFRENIDFDHGPVIENTKRPDFLFPSVTAYEDKNFPSNRLRMLATKTTCKDRWRQILQEADRINTKHLLTLQEGISENQFTEMRDSGVCLVVPKGLHSSYPESVRPHLITLEEFMGEVRLLSPSSVSG